jgi:V/A-type H+-transporting ATPase subunit K
VGKAIAAGMAMGLSALGAGYAQAKIGSAGAGALAERPDISIWIITLQALPEVIVLLGFVSAILISGS